VAKVREKWTEEDSQTYRGLAAVAVPERARQLATLLALLPFTREERFHAVELGCGEGALSAALLDCFPNASVLALDASPSMRARAAERLSRFGARAVVAPAEFASPDWLEHLNGADAVLSSLCLHHLSGPQKQALFAEIGARISACGALLIADLVEPQTPAARTLFAEAWDRATEHQSIAAGTIELYDAFRNERWNYYRFPDPADQPSPLFDQLVWLKTAGFEVVDCFRLQAGHAIFGGYKRREAPTGAAVSFEATLQFAELALGAARA
jgi:tRNA (cmo5U34)-methyltransferase